MQGSKVHVRNQKNVKLQYVMHGLRKNIFEN